MKTKKTVCVKKIFNIPANIMILIFTWFFPVWALFLKTSLNWRVKTMNETDIIALISARFFPIRTFHEGLYIVCAGGMMFHVHHSTFRSNKHRKIRQNIPKCARARGFLPLWSQWTVLLKICDFSPFLRERELIQRDACISFVLLYNLFSHN